jgi:hypothetical protein
MNYFKNNHEIYQHYANDDKFILFNISSNNVNLPCKELQNLLRPLELVTYPGNIQTWLGIKKSLNKDNFVWIKITNSHNEDNNDFSPHYHRGFYLSIIGQNNTLIIQYNDPISYNQLQNIISNINKLQYIKHFDFIISIIEKILKRKPDFLDQNI